MAAEGGGNQKYDDGEDGVADVSGRENVQDTNIQQIYEDVTLPPTRTNV